MQEENAVQKLYAEQKSKGFVNHLIGAYLPINKVTKVWEFKKGQKHRCNVCSKKLFDIQIAWENMVKNDEKLRAETMDVLKRQVNGEEVKIEEHPMYKYVTQGAVQAHTGEKTDTCLCMGCIQDLLDLTQTGLLTGDKNISWRVNKMRREETFNVFKDSERLQPEEKKQVEEIANRVEKSKEKKITTFGDLQVLQDLKKKMESDGKD